MKAQEDFTIGTPFSYQQTLDRLKELAEGSIPSNFKGTAAGNHFQFTHSGGNPNDEKDDPEVSGYVVADGAGSLIYARVRIADSMLWTVRSGLGVIGLNVLILLVIVLTTRFKGDDPSYMKIVFLFISTALTVWAGWAGMKNFKSTVNPRIKEELIALFDADTLEQETSL